ncbi:VOC family protein [Streptomyces sp. ODS28]|uniref:VOC family protein n=1 Tax=Streptomyces sp. ODS28 TaxID=3136688 RepID=UPI0031E7961A
MDWSLEVVAVPVSDVDAARDFYARRLGFRVDHDTGGEGTGAVRSVRLTPPGSACAIVIGDGLSPLEPGALSGLRLVVEDLRAARALLLEHGVPVSDFELAGPEGLRPARGDESHAELETVGFLHFADPDGNVWAVQQISTGS